MQEIEQRIIQDCIRRDTRAEYAMYKHCFGLLMPICYRYTHNEDDAADLLNRGFLKILANLDKYDPQRPFSKWIKSIMVNSIIDEFRANKSYNDTIRSTDLDELGTTMHPIELNDAETWIDTEEVHRCISKLPEASKVVLNLYVFDGLNHKEISNALHISEGTSKWHLSNARSLLKQMLKAVLDTTKTLIL